MSSTIGLTRRLALESVVVIASILVAFLLDAWWDGVQFRRELNQEIASVAREIDDNRELVAYEIRALERIIVANESVAARLTGTPEHPVAVTDTLAWFVTFWSPTLDVSFGALDALIASRRLAQIENPDLRVGLAGLKGLVADAVADEMLAQVTLNEQVYPSVSQHIDFTAAYYIDKAFFALPRQLDRQVPSQNATVLFPSSLGVRNAILNRTSWLGSALSEMKPLLIHLDSLRALLRQSTM